MLELLGYFQPRNAVVHKYLCKAQIWNSKLGVRVYGYFAIRVTVS